MGVRQYVLHESASGFGLFEVNENEEIGNLLEEVQQSVMDLAKFGRVVKLKAFHPFSSAENALQNINDISEGLVGDDLKNFLEMNLPAVKAGKKAKFQLGCLDKNIAQGLSDQCNYPCNTNETTSEIARGIRLHFNKFVKQLDNGGLEKAQLGLGHSYSRAKVKFNVNRADNMIIQSICLLDQMDKDINTFAMRVREWYSWHFPELARIVKDNYIYARCASFIKNRTSFSEESLEGLTEITMDEDISREVLAASRVSMGMDMSDIDMINIDNFTSRLISLAKYRIQLQSYLVSRMSSVAPNLAALIGEAVAARLISHAGSLTNLAKCPASTVQILGAEKALFRALKTKGNTPKYGLIFHSSFIGRAGAKNKGRISRYLANKCAIASRIDSFIDTPTTKFGEEMKQQVEERLAFYEHGTAPRKNIDVMKSVSDQLTATEPVVAKEENKDEVAKAKKDKKKKKKKSRAEEAVVEEDEEPAKKKTKTQSEPVVESVANVEESVEADKKKKKKKKKKSASIEA